MVAKVRERLAVSKDEAQRFDGERFNLRELNELEVRKHYQIGITNSLQHGEDINRDWKNSKEKIKTSAKERLIL